MQTNSFEYLFSVLKNFKHLLDEAGSSIKIYSVELKISDEAEGRVGYFFSEPE